MSKRKRQAREISTAMPHAITASDGVPSVDLSLRALKGLLDKARQLKPQGGIDPILTLRDYDGGHSEIEALRNISAENQALRRDKGKEKEKATDHNPIDASLKKSFYEILSFNSINDPEFTEMWSLLDISVILSDDGLADLNITPSLVEELLESQTLDGCHRVFDYLESRREAMVAMHYKTKHLTILRACNELLKRLSRAENTVFCGRVFIYLFSILNFGDRSSVNLRGEFHVANVTTFDDIQKKPAEDPMAIDIDQSQERPQVTVTEPGKDGDPKHTAAGPKSTEMESTKDKQDQPLDLDSLYPIFWSLQEHFCKPTKLFEAKVLTAFKSGLEATLLSFKQVQKDSDTRGSAPSGDESKRSLKRKWQGGEENTKTAFNPKYLTNRDLFSLEIKDLAFRRHILVQSLIVINFLLSQTPKAKAKLEDLKNKSVIYSFTLDDTEAKWAEHMKTEIATYLQLGNEGRLYYRMVDTVLTRDNNWIYWKAESCPLFSRSPVAPAEYIEARNGAKKASMVKRPKNNPMGALMLDFLKESNTMDGLEKLRNPGRYEVPALDSYRKRIETDDLDIDFANDTEEKASLAESRASKLWRTLRIASKSRFSVFDKLDDGNKLDPLFNTPEDTKAEQEAEAQAESEAEAEASAQAQLADTMAVDGAGDASQTGKPTLDEDGEDVGEGKTETLVAEEDASTKFPEKDTIQDMSASEAHEAIVGAVAEATATEEPAIT